MDQHYEPRIYRNRLSLDGMVAFNVICRETDLWIAAGKELKEKAFRAVREVRGQLEAYIRRDERFLTSLEPLPVPAGAPPVVREMARMSGRAGVGPMAAVAGAIAEAVGQTLLAHTREIIVENGGDIFIRTDRERTVEVLVPPRSPFYRRVLIKLKPAARGFGVCTSSGTIGHSLSFGTADAVVVRSGSTALADAAATAIGNRVSDSSQLKAALAFGRKIQGVVGILIIKGDKVGVWGEMEMEG